MCRRRPSKYVITRGPVNLSLTYESTASNGYAHVEFASTEDALRAVRQGAPHGFRYRNRSVDVDFALWEFYVGPMYRAVYISGWPGSKDQPALLKWTDDIPNIAGATVCTSLFPFTPEISTLGLMPCRIMNNSAATSRRKTLRPPQRVFAI